MIIRGLIKYLAQSHAHMTNIINFFSLISFVEFHEFEGRLCVPNALYRTAFQLFDTEGSDTVSFDNFRQIVQIFLLKALHFQNRP